MGKTHFVSDWLQYRPNIEEEYKQHFFQLQKDIKKMLDIEADERIIRNYATILASFAVLESKIKIPFTMDRAIKVSIACIKEQMGVMNSSSEVGQFWNIIESLLDTHKIRNPFNFKIDLVMEEEVSRVKDGELNRETVNFAPGGKELLYLRWTGIYQQFAEAARKAGIEIMPEKSTLHYLEHSKAYLGKKRNVRFDSSTTTAMIFDYELLRIDLKRNPVNEQEKENIPDPQTKLDVEPVEILESNDLPY